MSGDLQRDREFVSAGICRNLKHREPRVTISYHSGLTQKNTGSEEIMWPLVIGEPVLIQVIYIVKHTQRQKGKISISLIN